MPDMNLMHKYALREVFSRANDIGFNLAFYAFKFFTNENFLHLKCNKHSSKLFARAIDTANLCKNGLQKKTSDIFKQKSYSGDLAPKPTMGVAMEFAKDSFYLLNKASPILTKSFSNPMSIGLALVAATACILVDDSSRNMIMDQLSQLMAIFQNENGKVSPPEGTTDSNLENVKESKPAHKYTSYYL